MVALTAPPAQRKSQRRRPSSTKLSSRETHNRSVMRRHSREHTCMQEFRLLRDDSAKSDTSTQGIRHPIPTTPPGDPHNAFS